jgi:hypothetical protein
LVAFLDFFFAAMGCSLIDVVSRFCQV